MKGFIEVVGDTGKSISIRISQIVSFEGLGDEALIRVHLTNGSFAIKQTYNSFTKLLMDTLPE